MLSGFNTNLTYRDIVLHIQTEDAGARAQYILTTVFHGGAVIATRKTSYPSTEIDSDSSSLIRDLMSIQHKEMMDDLLSGRLDLHLPGPSS